MPSVNLIWEQRLVRRKQQRIVALLVSLIGLGILVGMEEVARTAMLSADVKAKTKDYQEKIRENEPDAKLNAELQAQIGGLRPRVALVEEAQKITLRWVNLLSELDNAMPDAKRAYLSQCSFSATVATGKKVEPGFLGMLTLAGAADCYDEVSRAMGRLAEEAHIRTVRLFQAQATAHEGIRFSIRAQFCEEEPAPPPAEEAAPKKKGRDYAAMLQDAGKDTVLNRTAPTDDAASKGTQ